MLDFSQKRKLKHIAYHPVTLVIMAILVIYSIYSTYEIWQKMLRSRLSREQAQNRLDALQARENEIKSKIGDLQTSAGEEAEIRTKFDVAKKDENVVIVLNEQNAATTTPKKAGFWEKILNIFANFK